MSPLFKTWVKKYQQQIVNVVIFADVGGWVGWQTYKSWSQGNFGFVEVSFAIQNLILITLFLVRRPHTGVDRNLFHQFIAVIAFFSGLAFLGQPHTGNRSTLLLSSGITLMANILSILTLLNLGRSFGVLIAVRKVQTKGLYSLIRHPMYLSDILFRIGYLCSHLTWITSLLFVGSTACYVYRALLEERFLEQQEDYRAYMGQVKYRFIPYIF